MKRKINYLALITGIIIMSVIGCKKHQLPTPVKFSPLVEITSPNGGEIYYFGSDLIFTAKINSQKIGELNFYLTNKNKATDPGLKYFLIGFGGFNPTISSTSWASVNLSTKHPPYNQGDYYLMAEWKSQDGTESYTDFSDRTFQIMYPSN